MKITSEDVLVMKKERVQELVRNASPKQDDTEFFHAERMKPDLNTMLQAIQKFAGIHKNRRARVAKRDRILLPAIILVPPLTAIFVFHVERTLPALYGVLAIVAVLTYMMFFGKILAFRTKRFDQHVATAHSAAENATSLRASKWARDRYALPAGKITFTQYGGEFYLQDDKLYQWVEVEDDGWRLFLKDEDGVEAPLKASAAKETE